MATVNAASMMQTANLATTATATNVSPTSTVRMGALRCPTTRRASVLIRAAGNPERIDNFVEGAKSDASKNARNFGNTVAEKVGDVERTIKDVGRDMGAKSQEAVDAASQKVDETGDKANQVGDEVKTSTNNTLDAATETRSDQSVVDKAQNAAANVGDNLKQNFDYGTGAVKNAAVDSSKDAKKAADRS